MSEPIHRYTFHVRFTDSRLGRIVTYGREVGINEGSPAAAERRVRDALGDIDGLELRRITKAGEGCGDERCAVCYPPSSRRAGS